MVDSSFANQPAPSSPPTSPAPLLSPAPAPATFFKALEAGANRTVIVYGTSLTHGGEWVKALEAWFAENYPRQITVINRGGSGENSDWGVRNLQEKILNHRPDLVFVEFAYNDAHDKFQMPVERGAANLKAIVEGIRQQSIDTVIVLQTMNVGWDAPNGNRSASVRPGLNDYYDNYRRLAAAERIPILDHCVQWKRLKETAPETFQSYVPDGSHPTPAASLEITWPTIRNWLEAEKTEAREVRKP